MDNIHHKRTRLLTLLFASFFATSAFSSTIYNGLQSTLMTNDSIVTSNDVITAHADTLDQPTERRGIVKKVVDYFRNSNKPASTKKVDFGFIPGPNYSSTTGLGLGLLGTATYSTDRTDPTLPRSNASVYSNMTTGGFFMVGLRGNHIFPHDRFRLDYKLNLSTFTTSFWGIGYEQADNDDNETDYRRNRVNAMARFMVKLAKDTYVGPFVNYRFIQARGVDTKFDYLWQGQDKIIRAYTLGLSFTYDSRDFMLNASRGVFLQVDQTFTPRFLGNENHSFSTTEATISTYKKAWKGAIIAAELHGMFNYGRTPWPLLAEVGSNDRMRGYYAGRYADKDLIEGQVELRQHIKGRSGIAVWGALANAFPDFDHIAWRRTLPNAGVGYRWEFKKRINIRIDYGFTRNGGGLIFNINEAF